MIPSNFTDNITSNIDDNLKTQEQRLVKPNLLPTGKLKTHLIMVKTPELISIKFNGIAKLTSFAFSHLSTFLNYDLTNTKGKRLGFILINVLHGYSTTTGQCFLEPNTSRQCEYKNIEKALTEIAIRVSFAYGHNGQIEIADNLPQEIHYRNGLRFPKIGPKTVSSNVYFILKEIDTGDKYNQDLLESTCLSYIKNKNDPFLAEYLEKLSKEIVINPLYPELVKLVAKELKRSPLTDLEVINNSFIDLNTILDRVLYHPEENRNLSIYHQEHYHITSHMELSEESLNTWMNSLNNHRVNLKIIPSNKKNKA